MSEVSIKAPRENSLNFEEVTAKLHAAADDAVATLHAGLFEGSPSTRLRAAWAIVNLATTYAELGDLKRRLGALERRK